MAHNPNQEPVESAVLFNSYPRSGSNWVRTIISKAIDKNSGVLDLIKSHDIDKAALIPFRDERLPYIKTHFRPTLFPKLTHNVRALIHIYRHPLDILLSSINYLNERKRATFFRSGELKTLKQIIIDGEIDYYTERFVSEDGLNIFKGMCGHYSQFHYSVSQFSKLTETHIIRYESLVGDKVDVTNNMLAFLGLLPELDTQTLLEVTQEDTKKTLFGLNGEAFTHTKMLSKRTIKNFYYGYSEVLYAMGYPHTL